MKYLILISLLFFVGCSKSNNSDPAPVDKVEPGTVCCGFDEPEKMISVTGKELRALKVKHNVSNEEAGFVNAWVMFCRPELIENEFLNQFYEVERSNNDIEYYRYYPIFAYIYEDFQTGQKTRENPRNYDIADVLKMDPDKLVCNIPPEYEIIGYVSARSPLTRKEMVESGLVEPTGDEACDGFESLEIKAPTTKSSYELIESCNDGKIERTLYVTPENKFSFSNLSTLSTSSHGICEIINERADILKEYIEVEATLPEGESKELYKELIADMKNSFELWSNQEGMIASMTFDIQKEIEDQLEEYRILNQGKDLEVKLAETFKLSNIEFEYDKSNVNPLLVEYMKPLTLKIPHLGWDAIGPRGGTMNLSILDACLATNNQLNEEGLKSLNPYLKNVR